MSGVSAVVLIKAETSLINELAEQLAELPGVAEVFSVAGQYDLVALVRVRENEELAEVISHRMRKLEGILGTETLIAFRVYTKAELSSGFDMD
jgi:DNA-binding Lrp family transcriptional regulator